MIPTAVISFREFLEAFLIVGVFLGISRKTNLKKEGEIGLATFTGVGGSFILVISIYLLGDAARTILTEERAELLANYLLLFSGFFLAYVIFSLHNKLNEGKNSIINHAKTKLEKQAFNFSLFTTIVLLISREGFEIAIFTASTSLLSVFLQNVLGLIIGFVIAGIVGTFAYISYTKFPINKVFKVTEYMIILLGASMVQVGLTELLEHQFNFYLADIESFGLNFLPDEHSIIGNLIRTFTGIDKDFSLPRLLIMVLYMACIYVIIKYRRVLKIKNKKIVK